MVRSTPQNPNNSFADNWVEIGALIPMSPRTPYITPRGRNSIGLHKRRYIPSKTMVKSAIKTLMRNPRTGVSFKAIKKFIAENYHNTSSSYKNNRFHFVKRYIKKSLEKGELIRTKGVGVSGSFRLPFTQQIIKKKTKRSNKNKKKQLRKAKKANRKQTNQEQLKEKDVSTKPSRAKVESSTRVGNGGGEADENLPNVQEKIVNCVSRASVRKVRKPNETQSQ